MKQRSRTYRLTLSNKGITLLIEAHCHLIRSTRVLLAWGTTLHVAVHHLAALPVHEVKTLLDQLSTSGLIGEELHFVGAPSSLNDAAARIIQKVCEYDPVSPPPELRGIYIVSLEALVAADPATLASVHRTLGA